MSSNSAKLYVNMSGKTECIHAFEKKNTFSAFVHIKHDNYPNNECSLNLHCLGQSLCRGNRLLKTAKNVTYLK